jgi:hypothetical protein
MKNWFVAPAFQDHARNISRTNSPLICNGYFSCRARGFGMIGRVGEA